MFSTTEESKTIQLKHQEVFFKQREGTVQQEFVPPDQTTTQHYYYEVFFFFAMCDKAGMQKMEQW